MPVDGYAADYASLEARLGYRFVDAVLIRTALTHKSYLNENPGPDRHDNERLEFLGDAVLSLTVGHLLMDRYPTRAEGELSKARAQLVSEPALAEVAEGVALGEWLFLGRGEEQTGGRHKASLLADACEAVIGAVYLDGGFGASMELVRRLFGSRVEAAFAPGSGDFKTRLQELAQSHYRLQPRYHLVASQGPDHEKTFEIALVLGDKEVSRGQGRSKKEAEQRAAERALVLLEPPPA